MIRAESNDRDRRVERVLKIEALANFVAMVAKLVVGFATGSIAVMSDAIHSLADLTNNALAAVAVRLASAPPDHDHPSGIRGQYGAVGA